MSIQPLFEFSTFAVGVEQIVQESRRVALPQHPRRRATDFPQSETIPPVRSSPPEPVPKIINEPLKDGSESRAATPQIPRPMSPAVPSSKSPRGSLWTVRRSFDELLTRAPAFRRLSQDRKSEVAKSVDRWEAFWKQHTKAQPDYISGCAFSDGEDAKGRFGTDSGNGDTEAVEPPLGSWRKVDLAAFDSWLDEQGLGFDSRRKILGAIRQIASEAADNGICNQPPKYRVDGKAAIGKTTYWNDDQLAKLLAAALLADWPQKDGSRLRLGYTPAQGWACLFALELSWGMRPGDIVAMQKACKPITWGAVHFLEQHPTQSQWVNRNGCGWLVFETQKKDKLISLPMNAVTHGVTSFLAKHRRETDASERVFHWPANPRQFSETWTSILICAEILPPEPLKDSPAHDAWYETRDVNKFYSFRKTTNTRLRTQISKEFAEFSLAHASGDVNTRHYTEQIPTLLAGVHSVQYPAELLATLVELGILPSIPTPEPYHAGQKTLI